MEISRQFTLPLADGRLLEVHENGPKDGTVLLFHHGTPGCGLPYLFLLEAASRHGLRYVSASRPGYGSSTRHAGRRVSNIAADSLAVLDALDAQHCYVGGISGGGPHALACAALLPQRVRGAVVIASLAPYAADGLDFTAGMAEDELEAYEKAALGETAVRAYLEPILASWRTATPEQFIQSISHNDRPVEGDEGTRAFLKNVQTGLQHGSDGSVDDNLAFVQPWGFELETIALPTSIWHGTADTMVPASHGRWLIEHIPHAIGHIEEGLDHLGIGGSRIDQMLEELLAQGSPLSATR